MIQERHSSLCVLIFFLFLLSVISFSAGCGSSSSPVTLTISPQTAAIGTGQSTQFTATVSRGTVTWTASAGTIDSTGNYTAPSATQSMTVTVTATSMQDSTKSASATVNVVAPGQVAATANVQVASYTVSPAAPGNVSVQFGTDMNYGLTTWTQPVPTGGGAVSLFVAGMKGNTLYHMRGVVQFADGSQYMDPDLTFTTGAYPAAQVPVITATTTAGMTPQSGVELLDCILGNPAVPVAVVTTWAATFCGPTSQVLQFSQGLIRIQSSYCPNGHFLINYRGLERAGNGFELRPTRGGPDWQAHLANDCCGPAKQGVSGSDLRGLQHYNNWHASRFCDAAEWAPHRACVHQPGSSPEQR